jgi:hypothetical protein
MPCSERPYAHLHVPRVGRAVLVYSAGWQVGTGSSSSSMWDLQQHPWQSPHAGSRVVQRAIAIKEGGIYANPGLYDDVFSYRDFPKEVGSAGSQGPCMRRKHMAAPA